MVTGVGTDIIEIARIKQALEREGFADRMFTPAEMEYCLSGGVPAQRFAGRFAAKEAVAKSLGVSLSWQDVEILPDESGKPIVSLRNNAAEVADGRKVMVSISHCHRYAVAYAIAITNGVTE